MDAVDFAFPADPTGRVLATLVEKNGRRITLASASDGTLRFLFLLAALLSPRPPSFLALNEPETSLHPDMLEPLSRLVVAASKRGQVFVVTHSDALARFLEGATVLHLQKHEGATSIS